MLSEVIMKRILALIAVLALTACVPVAEAPIENVTQIQLSSSDQRRVQNAVKANLLDPESARFGPQVAFSYTSEGTSYRGVCGYVNARNRSGGFVGDTPYITIYDGQGWIASGPSEFYDRVCQTRYGVTPPRGPVRF